MSASFSLKVEWDDFLASLADFFKAIFVGSSELLISNFVVSIDEITLI